MVDDYAKEESTNEDEINKNLWEGFLLIGAFCGCLAIVSYALGHTRGFNRGYKSGQAEVLLKGMLAQ